MLSRQFKHAVKLAIRRSPFAPVLRKIFQRTPFTSAIEVDQRQGWEQAAYWLLSEDGQNMLSNPEFHRVLRDKINTEIPAEFLLTELRRQLLFADQGLYDNPNIQQLFTSLIRQVINNEYIWLVSEEEYA